MKSVPVRFFLIIAAALFPVLFSSCTFDSPSDPTEFSTKPVNPSPSNNSTNQSISLKLSWDAYNATRFDVYLDTQNPPEHIAANNITARSFDVTFLTANTKYFWKVVAKNSTGEVTSDIWSFTTGTSINPGETGQILIKYKMGTEKPNFVNMIFQVVGYDGIGIGGLNKTDFELTEDNQPVSVSESDYVINQKADVFDTLRVVLMLDNSTSLAPNIEQVRATASKFVHDLVNTTVDGKKLNVEVSIYTFSEQVIKLCDFLKDKDRLFGVVWDNYALGKASTNLYGAVITGASKWTDVMTTDKIRQGILIVFTDGSDTQGSRTLADALTSVYNKKVFTVGLGNEIEPQILERLGTAGYFQMNDINELESKFQNVQKEILDYINSFYVMKYSSPKRGNFDHLLRLRIKNNPNSGAASYIEGYYNSYGFYSN